MVVGAALSGSAAAQAGSGIPAAFHGHWALAAADCKAGEPTAILSIDAAGLHQAEGEMQATEVTVDAATPDHIVVQARNAGGGDEWTSVEGFTLDGDGQSLTWQTLGAEAPPATRLFRCD